MNLATKVVVLVAVLALLQVSCAIPGGTGTASRQDPAPPPTWTTNCCPAACATRGHPARGREATTERRRFKRGESGGGPAACDGHFHSNGELIVALSTDRSVEARVMDECDSRRGCRHSIVDSSPAVWRALGLDTDVGEVHVTWADA
ncbi:hypothetical protein BS78_01G194700 [Paspalum vaginatum]|nr:hypothetical protein BS78_01G194700 [Paspalum vaginatum]